MAHIDPEGITLVGIVARSFNANPIIQAVIIAAITAAATGYVSAQVLERQVGFLIQEIQRVDRTEKETQARVEAIALKQASVIGQADAIHNLQNNRIDRLENRK